MPGTSQFARRHVEAWVDIILVYYLVFSTRYLKRRKFREALYHFG
jgi:hypothetical protein